MRSCFHREWVRVVVPVPKSFITLLCPKLICQSPLFNMFTSLLYCTNLFDGGKFRLPFLTPFFEMLKSVSCTLTPKWFGRDTQYTHFQRSLNWHRFNLESSSKQIQTFFFFPPLSFYPATGPQKSLTWLCVLQHDLLYDFLICCSKLATSLWSGTWDFRGVNVDARRTCCVLAAISQFGNIIEKVSCHAVDKTGEQRADAG